SSPTGRPGAASAGQGRADRGRPVVAAPDQAGRDPTARRDHGPVVPPRAAPQPPPAVARLRRRAGTRPPSRPPRPPIPCLLGPPLLPRPHRRLQRRRSLTRPPT